MILSDIEKLVSRAQILSIVDATDRKLTFWFGSVSAGKTVASLFAFLLAVVKAPKTGIIIAGGSLQTIYQNVFVLFQNTAIFGSVISSQIEYTPGATSGGSSAVRCCSSARRMRRLSAAFRVRRWRSRTSMRLR